MQAALPVVSGTDVVLQVPSSEQRTQLNPTDGNDDDEDIVEIDEREWSNLNDNEDDDEDDDEEQCIDEAMNAYLSVRCPKITVFVVQCVFQ